MWDKRQISLLMEELELNLAPLHHTETIFNLVKEPLSSPKRCLAFAELGDKPWPLLPLVVSQSISGTWENSLPVAVAIQLLLAAGDVFDDIEDADSPTSLYAKYGLGIATNVATTLLILAEKSLTRLHYRGVEDRVVVHILDEFNAYFTTACIGQHLDLSVNQATLMSEETYQDIISLKSASQLECACYIGALLSTNDENILHTIKSFGYNLGMASQISNDILGVSRGSDIEKRKITLPIIYALNQDDPRINTIINKPFLEASDTIRLKELLFQTGSIHYAALKMEHYTQLASNALKEASLLGVSTEYLTKYLN